MPNLQTVDETLASWSYLGLLAVHSAISRGDGLMTRIDPQRLARALFLETEPLPDGRYLVIGDANGYVVDRDAPPGRVCTCPDHQLRHLECKHALAARLSNLDDDVRAALRDLVTATERQCD